MVRAADLRRCCCWPALALLLGWGGEAVASPGPLDRLEPLLRHAALRQSDTLARVFPAAVRSGDRVAALVRLCPGAPADALAGFYRGEALGPVVPVVLARSRLVQLGDRPGVCWVEASRTLRPTLELSAPLTGTLWARQNLGLDGRGVVIGVVDSGIDFRHPDFRHPDGSTRLLYLVDYARRAEGSADGGQYRPAVHGAAEIDRQLAAEGAEGRALSAPPVTQRDLLGHGTHVAGIAAGNGLAASPGWAPRRYVGVAPGAAIVGVQASRKNDGNFHDVDVVAAVSLIFRLAEERGLPAVVNLSVGTQLGPHDGTSNLAAALAALAGPRQPGRVIVASAGNDGGRDLHASGYPAADGPSPVWLEIPPYTPGRDRDLVHLELWYAPGDLALTITSPGGRTLGPVPTGSALETLTEEGLVKVSNAEAGPYPGNGRFQAVVLVQRQGGVAPAPGRWRLELSGGARRYDLWLVNPAIRGTDGRRPRLAGPLDPDGKLSSPGTSPGVICVGAYTSRDRWLSQLGEVRAAGAVVGQHAFFSATGPAVDGRLLPDVVAPGEFIVGPLSADVDPRRPGNSFYSPETPGATWHADPLRGVLRGTSQAAPHVAGVAALLLQRRPTLTLAEVRALLRGGASPGTVPGPGHAWSPRWGFGRVDARGSLEALEGRWSTGPADPRQSGVALHPDRISPGAGVPATAVVVPRDGSGRALGPGQRVTVTLGAGPALLLEHRGAGVYRGVVWPEAGARGTLRLSAQVEGIVLERRPSLHLVRDRTLLGGALRARGGGCATAPPAPAAVGWGPLLGLILLLGQGWIRRLHRRRHRATIRGR